MDDSHWILGSIYFNRDDPSVFVERRFGIGWTINFGSVGGVLTMVALLAVAVVLPLGIVLLANHGRRASMRIAVYRAGVLGDMLLTFPALVALRKQWPDAHIELICRADVHALAFTSGLADRTLNHALPAWTVLLRQ